MNREIKFRGWNKLNKKMCQVECWTDFGFIKVKEYEAEENYRYESLAGYSPWADEEETENYELMQFTGLRDKNGTDIYDGDIFIKIQKIPGGGGGGRHSAIAIDLPIQKFEIMWCNGAFKYMEMTSMITMPYDGWLHELSPICICNGDRILDNIEVIGNIYENPELLK